MVQATANKHQYGLAARAWMPDHLHLALRGNIEESPGEISLSLMNNTAFAMGQNAIWQRGFYAGTFSEYDVRAVGKESCKNNVPMPRKDARLFQKAGHLKPGSYFGAVPK